MTPEDFDLIKDEWNMPREELLRVILELKKRSIELQAIMAENNQATLAMVKDYQKLQKTYSALQEEHKNLKETLLHVSQVAEIQANEIFGRSTEKLADILDKPFGKTETDEADQEPVDSDISCSNSRLSRHRATVPGNLHQKNSSHKKHKEAGKREADFSHLPQEQLFLLDIEALNQEYGEGNWRIAYWHRHAILEEKPSSVYVQNTYTPVISVGLDHSLVTLPFEAPLWQRSFASPSIVAKVIYQKFFLSIPLYRQEQSFKDFDVSLSRQTMSNWVLHFAFAYFGPVYEFFTQKLLELPYQQCDETTLIVNHDQRRAGTKSFMWVHTTSKLAEANPIILFCFELTRGTDHLRDFYKDFKGSISCDAYCAYKTLEKEKLGAIIICCCFMHMRRKFVESLSLIDTSSLDDDSLAALPEMRALLLIGKIYDADEQLKDLTVDERNLRRESEVRPLVEEYFQYIESIDLEDPLVSERLNDAVTYSINHKESLCQFLNDGNIPIDNQFVEECIRPFAVFRRNSLFCDTIDGAKATAILHSIVETAHANGANVYWYLRYILEKMPHNHGDLENEFLEKMMPWSQEYREYEKIQRSNGPPELRKNEYRERPGTPRKKRKPIGENCTDRSA